MPDTEKSILNTLEEIKQYLVENKNNNKLLKPFDVQLCNLIWEILLFYTTNERSSEVLAKIIEQFVEIELLVNNRDELAILTRLFCPRNTYFLKSLKNKVILDREFNKAPFET